MTVPMHDYEEELRLLASLIPLVTDEESLLVAALHLISGSCAYLIEAGEGRDWGKVLARQLALGRDDPLHDTDYLVAWYDDEPRLPGSYGFVFHDRPWGDDGVTVPEALLARPDPVGVVRSDTHELLVFGDDRGDEEHQGHRCWMVAQLLSAWRRHEEAVARGRLVDLERTARERASYEAAYSRLLGSMVARQILPNETWALYLDRLGLERPTGDQGDDPSLLLPQNAVAWTALRSVEGGEGRGDAHRWLRDQLMDLPWNEAGQMDRRVAAVLSLKNLAVNAMELILSSEPCGIEESTKLLGWLERAWVDISLLEVPGQAVRAQDDCFRILALVIDRGARHLLRKLSGTDHARALESGRALMSLSHRLALLLLCDENRDTLDDGVPLRTRLTRTNEPGRSMQGRFVRCELNRDTLRAHLLVRVAESATLGERYLSPEHQPLRPAAPPAVQQAYLRNLLTYLLWFSQRIQARFGLYQGAKVVSANSLLDALLHLVDRYAHVELGLDERFGVRRVLATQVSAEVRKHLRDDFYRDHLVHVIDVFLLGDLLLSAELRWLGESTEMLVAHLTTLRNLPDRKPFLPGSEKDWKRAWALAALFHDVGYQCDALLGVASKEGGAPPWTHFFALPGRPHDSRLAAGSGERDMDAFLAASLVPALSGGRETPPEWWPDQGRHHGLLRDHGVLSAIRLAQVAAFADDQDPYEANGTPTGLLHSIAPALRAIACHNLCSERVSLAAEPLSCLLRLCDEVQEWGRVRVNVERLLKQLYLDLLSTPAVHRDPVLGNDSIAGALVNLSFNGSETGIPARLQVLVVEPSACRGPAAVPGGQPAGPVFCFRVVYRDATTTQADTMLTVLSKAYNLQHLDLSLDSLDALHLLDWRLELCFPVPDEYLERGITEYDIYGLFTGEARAFPLFPEHTRLERGDIKPGLVRLRSPHDAAVAEDRFGIVISNKAGRPQRHGWLPVDPMDYKNAFLAFKKRLLGDG
jgi:hypothetical protein